MNSLVKDTVTNKYYVYGLVDTRDAFHTPFYIGYSGSIYRFSDHKGCLKKSNHHQYKYNKWKQILREGGNVEMIMLVVGLTEQQAKDTETHYIKTFRELGVKLTNMTDGGEGSRGNHKKRRPHTEEEKQKIKEARSKQIISKEHIQKLHASNKSEEYHKSLSEGQIKSYAEHPERATASKDRMVDRWSDPEEHKRMSDIMKGKNKYVRTEEHKRKLREASAKRWAKPEEREKARQSHLGKKRG